MFPCTGQNIEFVFSEPQFEFEEFPESLEEELGHKCRQSSWENNTASLASETASVTVISTTSSQLTTGEEYAFVVSDDDDDFENYDHSAISNLAAESMRALSLSATLMTDSVLSLVTGYDWACCTSSTGLDQVEGRNTEHIVVGEVGVEELPGEKAGNRRKLRLLRPLRILGRGQHKSTITSQSVASALVAQSNGNPSATPNIEILPTERPKQEPLSPRRLQLIPQKTTNGFVKRKQRFPGRFQRAFRGTRKLPKIDEEESRYRNEGEEITQTQNKSVVTIRMSRVPTDALKV